MNQNQTKSKPKDVVEPREEGLNEMPCSRLSDLLPPTEIVDAAEKVRVWMESNGYKNWQLGGVCDRRYADECKRFKIACDKWSEDEILHPLMHCQQCGKFQEHGHACDSPQNNKDIPFAESDSLTCSENSPSRVAKG